MKNKLPIADGQLPVAEQSGRTVSPLSAVGAHGMTRPARSIVNRESKIVNGFTLVELLVVISIIAVLAAFTVPVLSAVKKRQYISQTQGELGQLDAAIKSYHSAYGFYPPDNHNSPFSSANYTINQLYYELMGVTNSNGTFQTLDGRAQISSTDAQATFGVPGFMNCSNPGSGEDKPQAKSFISDLRPKQLGTNGTSPGFVLFLDASVGGPDRSYSPPGVSGLNPWRYNSSNPTNNPGSYDLWIQLKIQGKTYLICNWSKQVQINNPLP
jgi:prepilin-type N-terminal cleavage/methylation domain-containing protein